MAREPQKAAPCPICGKPATEGARPFCSKRCADVDLHRWMNGAYVIAGETIDDETLSPAAGETVWEVSKH